MLPGAPEPLDLCCLVKISSNFEMSSKVFVFAAFLAVTVAVPLTPDTNASVDSGDNHVPQYTFGYDVQDPFTGDSKSQVESRIGDVVQGSYSLNEPDGTRRIVDYTADDTNGFQAVVRKAPLVASASVVAPVVAPVAHVETVAPILAKIAPVTHVETVAPVLAKVTPVASAVSSSSSTVVHGPAVTHYSAPYGVTTYHAPVLNHLGYSSLPYNYGWYNPGFYSSIPHYRTFYHY
ncbi:hypothetical protein JTB14_007773 [Gonioctena quinquepunctata]|nr:hypothetical protein JTB14_007773 [Gonioctena quinquepunctata]